MASKAYRCLIELNVHAVTAPGTWLPARDDVYLSVCLLGQYRRTNIVQPIFPTLFHERLRFDRSFNLALDPHHVAGLLGDEEVYIELVQISDLYERGVVLATYSSNAREFLYPFASMPPSYGMQEREVLLRRTKDFPGMSPKLEFSCKTSIQQISPGYPSDPRYADSFLEEERMRRRARSATRHSRSRTRSPSPGRHLATSMAQVSFEDDLVARPPFAVRHYSPLRDTPSVMNHARRSRSRSPSASRRHRPRSASASRRYAAGSMTPSHYAAGSMSPSRYAGRSMSPSRYQADYTYPEFEIGSGSLRRQWDPSYYGDKLYSCDECDPALRSCTCAPRYNDRRGYCYWRTQY